MTSCWISLTLSVNQIITTTESQQWNSLCTSIAQSHILAADGVARSMKHTWIWITFVLDVESLSVNTRGFHS